MTRVNRHGDEEPFDGRKVYASVYHAARITDYGEQDAEAIADEVTDAIERWLRRERDTVSARQLRAKIITLLEDEDDLLATTYRQEVELV